MALEATAYRDSSSENTTLGSVARRRRCAPSLGKVLAIGERCVSEILWRFFSDSGLLRLESEGVGTAKKDLPSPAGPDLLTGREEKYDSCGFSSSPSV